MYSFFSTGDTGTGSGRIYDPNTGDIVMADATPLIAPPFIREAAKKGAERMAQFKDTRGFVPNAREREQARQKQAHKAAVERAANDARQRMRLRRETGGGELR